jgi:hypothetical protein
MPDRDPTLALFLSLFSSPDHTPELKHCIYLQVMLSKNVFILNLKIAVCKKISLLCRRKKIEYGNVDNRDRSGTLLNLTSDTCFTCPVKIWTMFS